MVDSEAYFGMEDVDALRKAANHCLPRNYNFELEKSVRRIRSDQRTKRVARQNGSSELDTATCDCKCGDGEDATSQILAEDEYNVVLQFPEGLLVYAQQIAQIIEAFTDSTVMVMGDVTYGACCIDDIVCDFMGADFLIHYGHSCLVPMDDTVAGRGGKLVILYVFVDIDLDVSHLVETVERNLIENKRMGAMALQDVECSTTDEARKDRVETDDIQTNAAQKEASCMSKFDGAEVIQMPTIALLGTIQFSKLVNGAALILQKHYGRDKVIIPQATPLTAGEVLGCTSPLIGTRTPKSTGDQTHQNISYRPCTQCDEHRATETNCDNREDAIICVFVADGRFHLESAMIQNPHVQFYRYDPFTKNLLEEKYNHALLHNTRRHAIHRARVLMGFGRSECRSGAQAAHEISAVDAVARQPLVGGNRDEAAADHHLGKIKDSGDSETSHRCVIGVVMSTLGRQGSVGLVERLHALFLGLNEERGKQERKGQKELELVTILMSEILPHRLARFTSVDVFVQVGCPRLSIDWGEAYSRPLLNPYEAFVAAGECDFKPVYPMDFYSRGEKWTNYYGDNRAGSLSARNFSDGQSLSEDAKRKLRLKQKLMMKKQNRLVTR